MKRLVADAERACIAATAAWRRCQVGLRLRRKGRVACRHGALLLLPSVVPRPRDHGTRFGQETNSSIPRTYLSRPVGGSALDPNAFGHS